MFVAIDTTVVAQLQIPTVRFTAEILQLQYIDKVVVVGRAGACNSRAVVEETAELPQLQPASWTWSLTCPLVCNNRDHRCISLVVNVGVLPQRQVPAVGLDSWDEG